MSLLLAHARQQSHAEMEARFKAYQAGLKREQKRMPARAYEFASAAWHYDYTDHRCPHDAWVNSVTVSEPLSEGQVSVRSMEIRIELLGAYHDGRILLTYPGVRQYSLFQPQLDVKAPPPSRGHGDWLVDEVSVARQSGPEHLLVVHEVMFASGGSWMIEAADILYEWIPDAREG